VECREVERLLNKYLRGAADPAAARAVEAHLESCAACQQKLDARLQDTETRPPGPGGGPASAAAHPPGLSEEKQRRILRWAKYKNRFSIALFLLVLFVALQVAGTLASGYFFNAGGEEARLYKAQRTAAVLTELTFPNVTMAISPRPLPLMLTGASWGHSSLEIKPYFAARGSYALSKRVGKDEYVIGHLNVNHFFSAVNTEWNWRDGAHNHYLRFFPPEQPADSAEDGEAEYRDANAAETWHALEVLPEGTVAELAVSFRDTHTTEEVRTMLSGYDLDLTWYAAVTGLEGETRRGENRRAPLAAFAGAWGFPDRSHGMFRANGSRPDDAARSEEYFLESMRFLVANAPLAERIYRGDPQDLHLAERHQYLQENGVRVYGAVVTGPTKELLKLRELEAVHSPALGEVRLWNWFQRDFSGTMY
jgi:hypothetical protein